VRIWDRRAPAQVDTPLTAHLDSVRAVAWAPDGIHLATGSDDKTAKIWKLEG
jgi:WD40 repeat protein